MIYKDIISTENLLNSWSEFVRGKKNKKDVAEFSLNLLDNIFKLHKDLRNKIYKHSDYEHFKISDPKPRDIHKASVRDRLLHHAICSIIKPYFDKKFIYDCYSSRDYKGAHRAMNGFRCFAGKVSKNHTKSCWVLKCDIRKFFATIDHKILLSIFYKHIKDEDINWLIQEIVSSFNTKKRKGLPLGNLTSQILVNVYMNEFDQYIKHKLKVKYYVRYADDFVILSDNKEYIEQLLININSFLNSKLKLKLHPNKVFIKTYASGVDFLGWVHFTDHRTLRSSTKRRAIKGVIGCDTDSRTSQSYLGLLKHGNGKKIAKSIENITRKDG
jgi:retron-type reverse transcriptase